MPTFTFTKVETGGKLVIKGRTEQAVRKRRNLDPALWTLDGPQSHPAPPETPTGGAKLP